MPSEIDQQDDQHLPPGPGQRVARRTVGIMSGTGTDAFVRHRNLLFTVAYEMLGSAADAEDVLQETWLRWAGVDHEEVRDQRAYLVRITTRLSLNRLRTLARQRETYVGPWLPEPLLTTPDVADDVELADSVSTARCSSCWRPCRRPSARCSCCARSSTSATTRSRPPSTSRRRRCARSRTAPATTSRPASRARR